MGDQPKITADSFITFTTREEMTSSKTRFFVASHTRKATRQKRTDPVRIQREKIIHSFLSWRFGATPSFQRRQNQSTSISQNLAANYQKTKAAQKFRRRLQLVSNTPVTLPSRTLPGTSKSEDEAVQNKRGKKRLQIEPAVSPRESINEYALSALPLDRGSFEVLQYLMSLSTYGIENFPIALMLSTSYTTLFHLGQIKMLSSTSGPAVRLKGEKAWKDQPTTASMHGRLLTAGKFPSILGQIIQGAMISPVHMYALLAMTARGMQDTAGVTVDPKRDSWYLMGKALLHLRKELARIQEEEGLIDKRVVLDIQYLFLHEWWAGHYTTALIHLRIVHSLLHILDRTEPMERSMFDNAVFDDMMICLETGTRPLRALDWSPPDLSAADQAEIKTNLARARKSGVVSDPYALASSPLSSHRTLAIFLAPLNADQKSGPLIVLTPETYHGLTRVAQITDNIHILTLLREIPLVIKVMQYTWIWTAPDPKYAQWATKKVHAIMHALLSIHLMGEWECVRLSLVMLLSVVSTNRAWLSAPMNASRLRAALTGKSNHLEAVNPPGEDAKNTEEISITFTDQGMLLWVLIVGAVSASAKARNWFVRRTMATAWLLGLRSGNQLREVLKEYPCLLKSQQTFVEELASMIEAVDLVCAL